MTPDRVIVVVPVKPLAVAKSRLNGVLEPEERTSLALNLLIRVLRAVQGVDVHGTWVVGGDSTVEEGLVKMERDQIEERGRGNEEGWEEGGTGVRIMAE